jgi:hypothetical protein
MSRRQPSCSRPSPSTGASSSPLTGPAPDPRRRARGRRHHLGRRRRLAVVLAAVADHLLGGGLAAVTLGSADAGSSPSCSQPSPATWPRGRPRVRGGYQEPDVLRHRGRARLHVLADGPRQLLGRADVRPCRPRRRLAGVPPVVAPVAPASVVATPVDPGMDAAEPPTIAHTALPGCRAGAWCWARGVEVGTLRASSTKGTAR